MNAETRELNAETPSSLPISELAAAIRGGSERALSRGLTWIEAGGERAKALIENLFSGSPWSHIVGITGAAGAGKSTLVAGLAREARRRGSTVAVLAIDPSSPYTGGAILGDRVRMSELSGDPGIFIRSMAARGELGGLCPAAAGAIDLLRAAGKNLILVETVGVGQDEVDVMRVAHTTVVVSVPGLGDDVQTLKAGLFEIADIHVVNKADRPGAEEVMAQIRGMLALGAHREDPSAQPPAPPWQLPVLASVALRGEGVAALFDAITAHAAHLRDSGELPRRERVMAEWRVVKLAQAMLSESLRMSRDGSASLNVDFERVARWELSPYACARSLLDRTAAGNARPSSK